MTRLVAFLVFPDFQILDLAGPLAAFEMACRGRDHLPYRLTTLSLAGGPVRSSGGLAVQTEALAPDTLIPDTLVVAGGQGTYAAAEDPAMATAVRDLAGRCRRLASVCSGAFLLAAAGLLDGRRATTHWRRGGQLQRLFPRVQVDADRIFIKDGPVWTSAGISAGIDLSLALIEEDLGAAAARAAARELVVYHRRSGGQTQFSALLELDPPSDRIRRALSFARDHLHEDLPVERLAEAACLSPRQFGRLFRAETGQTPAKAVERLRVEAARARLDTSREPVESVARAVGFTDPERMRRSFVRLFGHSPQAMRRTARQGTGDLP